MAAARDGMRRDIPPLLSTLNGNGRPRFTMTKVRRDGRLLIFMEEDQRPSVVKPQPEQKEEATSVLYSFEKDQKQLVVHDYFS
ncbi:hypothetical protein D8674_022749 [Pyrus ussuriensis x Pyrus communis]|uniref:Uncharacterized protein n=1 Tax=Pyrus ussuriensis x Pyrus communis TaxID=2448454 RepID=A0A5N5GQJ0_9ROSA|nr:hypothetical protein D8674_022749 [Pyrus ussuriensis x Pyrus communis]